MGNGITVEPSPIEGKGVFATAGFQSGEPILTIDDSWVVTDDDPLDSDEDERYYDYPRDLTVLMQPPERYINHSCDPNAYIKSIAGTRHVFARNDIATGEEITYDYRINSRGDTTWECDCGSERCTGKAHSDFFGLPRHRQLEFLPLLECWFIDANEELLEELIQLDN